MTETQYKKLCEVCDSILLSAHSTIECVSIPWLHIIREHPIFLINYVGLFNPKSAFKRSIKQKFIQLKYIVGWIIHLIRAIRLDNKMFTWSSKIPSDVDILFISHLLNSSQAGKSQDFYFDKVPEELTIKGYSSVIALINHSKDSEKTIAGKWHKIDIPRVIFHKSLGIFGDFRLFKQIFKESARLTRYSKKVKDSSLKAASARASIEALSGGTRNNLCLHKQIASLVKLLNPTIVIVTHEGHAWERLAFAAARESDPLIKCIGYQHSVLFRLQHAIRRNLSSKFNPDILLTSGLVSKHQLDKATDLKNITIAVLGSNRKLKGLRNVAFNYLHQEQKENTCLVLPEGSLSECDLLFEFSLFCTQKYPSMKFIWRLHPLMNFDTLVKNNTKLKKLPGNIVLSKLSLEDDIISSRYALYRGSSAIIQAASSGLTPIYLQIKGEMTIDPLYEIDEGKFIVTNVDDFTQVLNSEKMYCGGYLTHPPNRLISYCDKVFSKLNPAVILALMPKIKLD